MTERGWLSYRGFPVVFISPALYDAAEQAGYDMGYYRKVKPIPPVIDGETAGAVGQSSPSEKP